MASKRSSSPIRGDTPEAKKSKGVAESVRDSDSIPNLEPMSDDEWKACSEELKEWLKEQQMAKRDADGILTDKDALAKFQFLLRHNHKVSGKPSKAAELIKANYGFQIPKEHITDFAEAEKEKLLRYGIATSSLLLEHGAKASGSVPPASTSVTPAASAPQKGEKEVKKAVKYG